MAELECPVAIRKAVAGQRWVGKTVCKSLCKGKRAVLGLLVISSVRKTVNMDKSKLGVHQSGQAVAAVALMAHLRGRCSVHVLFTLFPNVA
ncbi:hypothetical protein E2C01_094238 [Portunus trituberculatus]|uniref:Uncharacterized protein n=1 Tax=Portunus trituberculatus TaxID=210409 RepID=A0A5B7JRX5_PORTR|nr:hypothetical protein [Portunus trituberculatus]